MPRVIKMVKKVLVTKPIAPNIDKIKINQYKLTKEEIDHWTKLAEKQARN